MNEPIRSFCPQCQADWDRPWYDVCPACGHRFKARPGWQSPWLMLGLVAAPALAILFVGTLPMDTLSGFWNQGRVDLMIIMTLIGSTLSAVPAGILFACRIKSTPGMRVLFSFIFIPVFYAVSFCLCFFACAGVGNR
jgi:hypothetical protein